MQFLKLSSAFIVAWNTLKYIRLHYSLVVSRVEVLRFNLASTLFTMVLVLYTLCHLYGFTIFMLGYIAYNARLNVYNYCTRSHALFGVVMLLCPVWQWLLLITQNSFINSWLSVAVKFMLLCLSSLFCVRVHSAKKVIVIKASTKDIHTLYHVSLYRYRLFTPHSTLAESIDLFTVLLFVFMTRSKSIKSELLCLRCAPQSYVFTGWLWWCPAQSCTLLDVWGTCQNDTAFWFSLIPLYSWILIYIPFWDVAIALNSWVYYLRDACYC